MYRYENVLLTEWGIAMKSRHALLPRRLISNPESVLPIIEPIPKDEPTHDVSWTLSEKLNGESAVCNLRSVGDIQPIPMPWDMHIILTRETKLKVIVSRSHCNIPHYLVLTEHGDECLITISSIQ